MDQIDRKAFAEALFTTAEIYDRKVSNAIANLYFADLIDYPIESVVAAFALHRRDADRGRFFPKVADLIDKLEGSMTDRAAVAWSQVVRLASNSSAARSDDPIAERTVADMGGWSRIGRTDERSLGFLAKEFERMYMANAKRGLLGSPRFNGPRLIFDKGE